MTGTKRIGMALLALAFGLAVGVGPAQAQQERIEREGRAAISGRWAMTNTNIDSTSFINMAIEGSYIFPNPSIEVGGGLNAVAFTSDDLDTSVVYPNLIGRFNFAFGSEENMILYTGLSFGVNIFTTEFDQPGDNRDVDGEVAGGFFWGAEYYFTRHIAGQLQQSVILSDDPTDDEDVFVNHTLAVGIKYLF